MNDLRYTREFSLSCPLPDERILMNDKLNAAGQMPLGLTNYQVAAERTDQKRGTGIEGLPFLLLGLFGEVGTLLSALKKKQREGNAFVGYNEAVIEEFGDVLWYLSNIASRDGLRLTLLAQQRLRTLHDWEDVDPSVGTFADLQSKRPEGTPESPAFEEAVITLAGRVGLLMNDFHLGKVTGNRDALSAHLIEVLKAIIDAADAADIDLSEAATGNLIKIDSRWPQTKAYTPLFDADFDEFEQLPRIIRMRIFERQVNNKIYVVQQCNGINIGSLLTDNRMTVDDYRFHDVFHLAYAAILGWSPVLRALFKLKRKSRPQIDEAQDGARAILIEEGVSTLVFHRAARLNLFESVTTLDYPLLKLIPEFVDGFEVEACPLWQWEEAILEGFRVFRELRIRRRGIVTADLNRRSISLSEFS